MTRSVFDGLLANHFSFISVEHLTDGEAAWMGTPLEQGYIR